MKRSRLNSTALTPQGWLQVQVRQENRRQDARLRDDLRRVLRHRRARQHLPREVLHRFFLSGTLSSCSYPMVMYRRMQPLLAAVGINLTVHNIAMGANDCMPYNICLESQGGRDPEFISWYVSRSRLSHLKAVQGAGLQLWPRCRHLGARGPHRQFLEEQGLHVLHAVRLMEA